jgi:hypothetical protein
MKKKHKESESKTESFFKIRKKIPRSGWTIKSRKDKEKKKRIKHRDLIKEIEKQ